MWRKQKELTARRVVEATIFIGRKTKKVLKIAHKLSNRHTRRVSDILGEYYAD